MLNHVLTTVAQPRWSAGDGCEGRRQTRNPCYGDCFEAASGQHLTVEGLARDAQRTRYLQDRGIRVVRFSNREILLETEGVPRKPQAVLLQGLRLQLPQRMGCKKCGANFSPFHAQSL